MQGERGLGLGGDITAAAAGASHRKSMTVKRKLVLKIKAQIEMSKEFCMLYEKNTQRPRANIKNFTSYFNPIFLNVRVFVL